MLTADDRLEILDLYARYNWAIDASDAETWADLFTPEGAFVRADMAPVVGRAALVEYARPRRAGRHLTYNVVVEGNGDEATGRAYVAFVSFAPEGGGELTLLGSYADALRRQDGRWRFARREVAFASRRAALPADAASAR